MNELNAPSKKSLNTALLYYLVAAVRDLFPGAQFGPICSDAFAFSLELAFPHAIHPELIPLLEEKIRGMVKGSVPIEQIEMSRTAAVHLFLHLGQEERAIAVEEAPADILPLVRIQSGIDLFIGAPYSGDMTKAFFKLFIEKEDVKTSSLTIGGYAFFSKEELKDFLKKEKEWKKANLLIQERDILLGKEIEADEYLHRVWRQQILTLEGVKEALTSEASLLEGLALSRGEGFANFYSPAPHFFEDRIVLPVTSGSALPLLISLLHLIQETFNMLELRATWVFCKKPFFVGDSKRSNLEGQWLASSLQKSGLAYEVDEGDNPYFEGARQSNARESDVRAKLMIVTKLGKRMEGARLTFSKEIEKRDQHLVVASFFGMRSRLIALALQEKEGVFPPNKSL